MSVLNPIVLPSWQVTGASAKTYLQGQITCDVHSAQDQFILGTLCNSNGIVVEWFWWHCTEEGGWFIAPPGRKRSFSEKILARKRWRDEIVLEPASIRLSTSSDNGIEVEGWTQKTWAIPQEGVMTATAESWNEWDTHRIRSVLPSHEHDIEESSRPQEIGLHDAVHENKGCYVGQEILARLDSLGSPKRQLIPFESASQVTCGDELIYQQESMRGIVTSLSETGYGLARFGRGTISRGGELTSSSGGFALCS